MQSANDRHRNGGRWKIKYWTGDSDQFFERHYGTIAEGQYPIVYHPDYNISFCGLEKLHPFDANKFHRIRGTLIQSEHFQVEDFVSPQPVTREGLLTIHTEEYLEQLQHSSTVAAYAEFPPLAVMPKLMVDRMFMNGMLLHVGGSILAGYLALRTGWAINLGGGMHHAFSSGGGGWCFYDDIMLSFIHLRLAFPDRIKRVMIIDLDVHQGNGHERDKLMMADEEVFIFDAYRSGFYPNDRTAARAIDLAVKLDGREDDARYLQLVRQGLSESFQSFSPDIVFYNAGTDILVGDPLGGMAISPEAVIERDEMVMRKCMKQNAPVVMLLSGGYTKPLSAATIARSILNMREKLGFEKWQAKST